MTLKAAGKAIFGSRHAGVSIGRVDEYEGSPLDEERRRAAGPQKPAPPPDPALEQLEADLTGAEERAGEARAKLEALDAALASARDTLATAAKAVDQARSDFGEALAEQELHGGTAPSRRLLGATEITQRDAEDRVRALDRRRPESQRIWRAARIEVLQAEEALILRKGAGYQQAINALAAERQAIDAREGQLFGQLQAGLDAKARILREIDELRRQRAAPAGAAE